MKNGELEAGGCELKITEEQRDFIKKLSADKNGNLSWEYDGHTFTLVSSELWSKSLRINKRGLHG